MKNNDESVSDFIWRENGTPFGIKFSYRLTRKELYEAFKHDLDYKECKESYNRGIVMNVLVLVILAVYWIGGGDTWLGWLMLFPIAALIVMFVVPRISRMKRAQEYCDMGEIEMHIYWDKVYIRQGGVKSEVPLNKSARSIEYGGLILIKREPYDDIVIPKRAIPEEHRRQARERIAFGTISKSLTKYKDYRRHF